MVDGSDRGRRGIKVVAGADSRSRRGRPLRGATLSALALLTVACGPGSPSPSVAPATAPPVAAGPTVTPAVPNLPPPPEKGLRAQKEITLPPGFVRDGTGRIFCEKDGAEMVLVPEGEFTMGDDESDHTDERPAHRVFVSSFLIDRHEVTVGQFRKFCAGTGAAIPVGQPPDEAWPVVNVTWDESKACAEWAGRRLPTEAEWEKAVRGPDGWEYPWGNQEPDCGPADSDDRGHPPRTIYPTGTNPYGRVDIGGNAFEWCGDWYGSGDYYGTLGSGVTRDPQGASSGPAHACRGGRVARR